MKKSTSLKKRKLTYKDKTNFPVGNSSDIFYHNFFQKKDIKKLIRLALKRKKNIDEEALCGKLNHIISFSVIAKHTKLKPGKSDKRKLIEKTCELAEDLVIHLDILTTKYGYDTLKHIPIIALGKSGWEKVSTYEYLSAMKRNLLNLIYIRDVAKKNINNTTGKKTGNNSKNAIPTLIFYLISTYENITNKPAKENFQQDLTGEFPYKGEFYKFTYILFKIINENYKIRYPDTAEPNPFEIEFTNKKGEASHALGKHIIKTFRLIDKKAAK